MSTETPEPIWTRRDRHVTAKPSREDVSWRHFRETVLARAEDLRCYMTDPRPGADPARDGVSFFVRAIRPIDGPGPQRYELECEGGPVGLDRVDLSEVDLARDRPMFVAYWPSGLSSHYRITSWEE